MKSGGNAIFICLRAESALQGRTRRCLLHTASTGSEKKNQCNRKICRKHAPVGGKIAEYKKSGKNQAEQRRFPILRQSMKHSPGQRTENPSPRYQRGPPDRKKRLSRLLSKDNDKKNQRGFKKVIKVLKQKYGNPCPPICS